MLKTGDMASIAPSFSSVTRKKHIQMTNSNRDKLNNYTYNV